MIRKIKNERDSARGEREVKELYIRRRLSSLH